MHHAKIINNINIKAQGYITSKSHTKVIKYVKHNVAMKTQWHITSKHQTKIISQAQKHITLTRDNIYQKSMSNLNVINM